MLDIPVSAVASSARIALQVASQYRRPAVEVYATLRNRIGPEEVYKTTRPFSEKEEEHRFRPQNVFVEFMLANIGGKRAEHVKLSLDGDFTLFHGLKALSTMGVFSGAVISQMAPAQTFPLFHIDVSDLEERGADGKVIGMKRDRFSIVVEYDAPGSVVSKMTGVVRRLRKKRQFQTVFTFSPEVYQGLVFPPPEYAG